MISKRIERGETVDVRAMLEDIRDKVAELERDNRVP
jgi:hypothetical protein